MISLPEHSGAGRPPMLGTASVAKKSVDAERGDDVDRRLSAVSTQVVGEINDVEILETTFGVSLCFDCWCSFY